MQFMWPFVTTTLISNVVNTTRFWKKLHQVRSQKWLENQIILSLLEQVNRIKHRANIYQTGGVSWKWYLMSPSVRHTKYIWLRYLKFKSDVVLNIFIRKVNYLLFHRIVLRVNYKTNHSGINVWILFAAIV
jgi:hypothetical protein